MEHHQSTPISTDPLSLLLPTIQSTSRDQLLAQMEQGRQIRAQAKESASPSLALTQEDRQKMKSRCAWSDDILQSISSQEEFALLLAADLAESSIAGTPTLLHQEINPSQRDPWGRSNLERMRLGKAPLDPQGHLIELHHLGNDTTGPLVQLTGKQLRGKGNLTRLVCPNPHQSTRQQLNQERIRHWKERVRRPHSGEESNHG